MPPKSSRTTAATAHRMNLTSGSHDEEEQDGGGWGNGGEAAAASSSAAAAAASSAAAAAAPAAPAPSSSNPLVDLLCDLKCLICLCVVDNPRSLPCNHFFCASCLSHQLASDAAREAAERKSKSNSTLRLKHLCPHCRQEYTKRNIVEDPLVTSMAALAMELRRRPDMRDLRDPDESILEMSQASAAHGTSSAESTPNKRITRRSASDTSSRAEGDMAVAAAPSTPVRRHSSVAASPARGAPHSPSVVYDPFAFHSTETQVSSGNSDRHAAATRGAAASHPSTPAVAHVPISSTASTPMHSARASATRKNYREISQESAESMEESLSGDDHDEASESEDRSALRAVSPAAAAASAAKGPGASYASRMMKQLKGYPITSLAPGTCHVCCQHSDEEATVTCRFCRVSVHAQLCYAHTAHTLTAEERANWHCDRCSETMGTKHVTCAVCPNTDDQAFKKTEDGQWVHASCALWIPELRYRYPDARQLVQTKDLDATRFSIACKFCRGKGAIIQCTFPQPKCRFSYHVPCGLRRGIEFELVTDGASQLMSQEEGSDFVFYHNFCAPHAKKKHLVPACNSAVASKVIKKRKQREQKQTGKQAGKRKRRGGGHDTDEDSDAEQDEDEDESEASDSERGSPSKRARGDNDRVNRSFNLADTRMDMTDSSSAAATPARPGGLSIASLITPQTASPLVLHTPHAPSAAAAAAAAVDFNTPPANRKLEFSTPRTAANITTSVGITTRTSPLKRDLPSFIRASSTGQLTSSVAAATGSLSRQASLRGHGSEPQESTSSVPAAAAAAASTPSRTPLRAMDRREVNARDNAAASGGVVVKSEFKPVSSRSSARTAGASSAAAGGGGGRLAKRHQLVIMGTRLDAEQQALLAEVVAVLNAQGKEGAASKDKHAAPVSALLVESWDSSVTHVVTAASSATNFVLPTRTIKYFQGLLSSCYVLCIDWAAACLSQQRVASEGDYLVQGDAKLNGGELTLGAKRARATREKLFGHHHFVLNMPFRQPLRADIEQLIPLGGGEVRDEFPAAPHRSSSKRGGNAREAAASHSSDIDESSQDDAASVTASPARPTHHPRAATPTQLGERGQRWLLLCDDTQLKGSGGTGSSRAQLRRLVSEQLWRTCEQRGIHVVGVSWLFDSISAFKLQPLPA